MNLAKGCMHVTLGLGLFYNPDMFISPEFLWIVYVNNKLYTVKSFCSVVSSLLYVNFKDIPTESCQT